MAQGKTLRDVIEAATGYLERKGVDGPRLACELLASRLLSCPRLELYVRFNSMLNEKLLGAMRRGVKRVGDGEPVQYVMGQTEFMGHVFKVDRRALIPRPETEVIVRRVLDCDPLWGESRPAVADIGTGCGCIVISLALAKPDALYLGLDTSDDAVALATENATRLNVGDKIGFSAQDIADLVEPSSLDAVVANLPYVTTADCESLPRHIREHEPRSALDGGPDGLRAIDGLVHDSTMILKPGGRLFIEIGADQAQDVAGMLTEAGFEDTAVTQDLAGRDRVVEGLLA